MRARCLPDPFGMLPSASLGNRRRLCNETYMVLRPTSPKKTSANPTGYYSICGYDAPRFSLDMPHPHPWPRMYLKSAIQRYGMMATGSQDHYAGCNLRYVEHERMADLIKGEALQTSMKITQRVAITGFRQDGRNNPVWSAERPVVRIKSQLIAGGYFLQ